MDIIKSDIVSLHGVAASMIGGRQENQDDWAYLDTPLGFLIIVCDGMGGGPGGKTASYIVKHEFALTICECRPQTSREHALKLATARAHQALEDKMKETPALSGMGSTFVAALFNRQSVVIAHAGDSRCYRIHGKKCMFRTQDHSLVAELVRKKVMTEEEARQSPQANVITRGLGSTNNHVPEIEEIPYKEGDRFVLCTDGVWGAMRHQDFLELLTQHINIQSSLSSVSTKVDTIGFAQGGGHDNHTIAIIELEEDALLKECISWRKWAISISAALLVFALVSFFMWQLSCNKRQKEQFTSHLLEYKTPATSSSGYNQNHDCISSKKITDIDDNKEGFDSNENGGDLDHKTGSNDTVKGYDTLQNDTLFQRLLQMGRIGGDSDSIIKQNYKKQGKKVISNSAVTIQKIINRYDSAKAVRKKTLVEAKRSLEVKKVEIKALFVELSEQTRNSKVHSSVEAINRVVDNPVSWYVNKEPDKDTKLFMPTSKAKEYINKQIVRLKELKNNLEKE